MVTDISNMTIAEVSAMSHEELKNTTLKDVMTFFRKHKNSYLGIIYSYTSKIDGKKYIGQTKRPLHRHSSHVYYSNKKGAPHLPFNKSASQHGLDAFSYNVLKVCVWGPIRVLFRSYWTKQKNGLFAISTPLILKRDIIL